MQRRRCDHRVIGRKAIAFGEGQTVSPVSSVSGCTINRLRHRAKKAFVSAQERRILRRATLTSSFRTCGAPLGDQRLIPVEFEIGRERAAKRAQRLDQVLAVRLAGNAATNAPAFCDRHPPGRNAQPP